MDYTLLYGAKVITKNCCSLKRIAFAATVGACFAILFPLTNLSGAIAIVIKIAAGLILCLICGKCKSFKGYIKFTLAFFTLTFVTGGMLLGIFSLANISYQSGGGFLISSVPIGIPLFCLLIIVLIAKKIASKIISNHTKISVSCRIYAGQCFVKASGFYDSGNKVYYHGQPISIIPKELAEKIIDIENLTNFTNINTAAGSTKIPIFTADKIEIDDGQKIIIKEKVKVGVASGISKLILHPDLAEVN
jgi:hypothetical protein